MSRTLSEPMPETASPRGVAAGAIAAAVLLLVAMPVIAATSGPTTAGLITRASLALAHAEPITISGEEAAGARIVGASRAVPPGLFHSPPSPTPTNARQLTNIAAVAIALHHLHNTPPPVA